MNDGRIALTPIPAAMSDFYQTSSRVDHHSALRYSAPD